MRRLVWTEGKPGRPLGLPPNRWHGVGYKVHAQRAAVALVEFAIKDVDRWCALLRVPVPEPMAVEGPGAVSPMRRVRSSEGSSSSIGGSDEARPRQASDAAAPYAERGLLRTVPMPDTAVTQASLAAAAIEAAYRDGCRRHCVELLLLDPETGQDDWPGGIRQQFRVAQPMVESILRTIKQVCVSLLTPTPARSQYHLNRYSSHTSIPCELPSPCCPIACPTGRGASGAAVGGDLGPGRLRGRMDGGQDRGGAFPLGGHDGPAQGPRQQQRGRAGAAARVQPSVGDEGPHVRPIR